jgi:heterotetrameric sarcosine oxidase gamma subunit
MAKGCAIDLHPRAFPIHACAAAGFAGTRTIIRRADAEGFELLIGRSHALSLWEWLVDAATESRGEGTGADRTNQREQGP